MPRLPNYLLTYLLRLVCCHVVIINTEFHNCRELTNNNNVFLTLFCVCFVVDNLTVV